MGKRTTCIALVGSLVTAGALCFGATAARAAVLVVGTASGAAGSQVTVNVSLTTQGDMVAGTQNDIAFDADTPVAAKSNGKPDCAVNTNLMTPSGMPTDKSATSFAFRPNGCSATGTPCTAIRALVLSTGNTDPVADGSVLYTCKVNISATAASGDHALTISGIILSDPNGVKITNATGTNGTVTVAGGGGPTPTATAGASCPAPRSAPAGTALWIPDQNGPPAPTSISVKLVTGGAQVAGTQNDITYDAGAPINAKSNGKPDCAVNTNLMTPSGMPTDKSATSFAFRPNGCSATGTPCTSVRALVLSTGNTDPLADGSLLYTCNITPPSGMGTFHFAISGEILSDPNGVKITNATSQDGDICIPGGVIQPTNTPVVILPTNTPVVILPTNTPVVILPTNTPAHVATATATKTAAAASTPTPGAHGGEGAACTGDSDCQSGLTCTQNVCRFSDEDGCQIGTTGHSSAAWLLVIPAIGLLIMRRRSR